MTAGVSCEVYVDGERLADTAADYTASAPTALTGLDVVWGRSTVVDQPDASSCSFTVADIGADADFLGLLHVGHIVDVYAAGAIGSSAPVDVTVDGSFETAPVADRVHIGGGTVAADTYAAVGARSIRAQPSTAAAANVAVPPGPFAAAPTAWNPIPEVTTGETWRLTMQVAVAPGVTVTVAGAVYRDPTRDVPQLVGPATVVPPLPGAAYQTVTVDYLIPPTADGWAGVWVTVTAPRWQDVAGTWAAQTLTWRQAGSVRLDDLHVLAPPQAVKRVLVFSGRITDLTAAMGDRLEVAVTASDRLADLGNDYIGDEPWLAQPLSDRVARIVALAATPFTVDVAAWTAQRRVSWVDVDAQPVAGLLAELATTADAVLWSVFAANRGFYLWLEDPAQRAAMSALTVDPGSGLVVVAGGGRPAPGVLLSACNLARNVQWQQDVSDVLSIVDLTWLEQTLDDQGAPAPTERHEVVTDDAALAEYGQRRAGYSTQLVTQADGNAVAQRVLVRSQAVGWKASGAVWDTALPLAFTDEDRATELTMLDGASRIGLPVSLADMPDWTPGGDQIGTYLEGGTYTYDGGRWLLSLTLSPSGLTGQSIQWKQTDAAYRWRDFDPAVEWFDLHGVGAG